MMFDKNLYTSLDRQTGDDSPMEQDEVSGKVKKLKHVKVYNRLYSMIQDGIYPPGSQLPSEPELAQQMDVSRMTLRRALALLQEDDLVINIRGKGNFINGTDPDAALPGMETIQHPVLGRYNQRNGTGIPHRAAHGTNHPVPETQDPRGRDCRPLVQAGGKSLRLQPELCAG